MGKTCSDHYMTITTRGQFQGTVSHNYSDASKNNSGEILYSTKLSGNLYSMSVNDGDDRSYDIIWKKLNDRQIRVWKLVYYKTSDTTDKTALYMNGKNIESGKDTGVSDKCW